MPSRYTILHDLFRSALLATHARCGLIWHRELATIRAFYMPLLHVLDAILS
jgi:hypothetical protein